MLLKYQMDLKSQKQKKWNPTGPHQFFFGIHMGRYASLESKETEQNKTEPKPIRIPECSCLPKMMTILEEEKLRGVVTKRLNGTIVRTENQHKMMMGYSRNRN